MVHDQNTVISSPKLSIRSCNVHNKIRVLTNRLNSVFFFTQQKYIVLVDHLSRMNSSSGQLSVIMFIFTNNTKLQRFHYFTEWSFKLAEKNSNVELQLLGLHNLCDYNTVWNFFCWETTELLFLLACLGSSLQKLLWALR